MPRLMSVTLTRRAVELRQKTQTRRAGWTMLRPGDRLTLCEKVMGRRKGDPLVRLAEVEVVAVRREPLNLITDAEVDAEGFGPWEGSDGIDWWPPGSVPPSVDVHGEPSRRFVAFFTEHMGGAPDQLVTVITWRYL
jgi:hypothetical protein